MKCLLLIFKACCRNILANLAKIYDKMEPSSNFTQVKALIERILVKPEHIKWIALCSVTRSTSKSTAILEIDPQISQTLLCSDRTMKYPVSLYTDCINMNQAIRNEVWV